MATNQTQPALEVIDLYKSFGDLEVLKGISLRAYEGEVVSLIGSSGSGKSTLLRSINMLEIPTSRVIKIGGEEIHMKADRKGNPAVADRKQIERVRASLGMVFQSFNLWPHMTVIENVIECPRHVLKKPRAECLEEAETILEKVGISDKRHQYPNQLSGGQQQRCAIARTLAARPALVLADEPTGNLDEATAEEVLGAMLELVAETGAALLMVTHSQHHAARMGRRLHLHAGRIA